MLGVLLVLYFAVIIAMIIGYAKIISQAGYSPWFVLLGLVPLVNIVMFFVFAFSDWPVSQELERYRYASARAARESAVKQDPAKSSTASAPGWVPPLQSQQWADALKAAAAQPHPQSQQLESAIRNASHREGLRAWLFGFDARDQTTLLLIFPDRIMIMECRDSGQVTAFASGDVYPIRMHTHRDVHDSISELTISRTKYRHLEPPEAVANFVAIAAQLPWIAVNATSEKSTLGSGVQTSPREPVASPSLSVADELTKLAKLKADGVLTEEEFAAQKRKLLS
jgi:hypothetical protein